MACDLFFRKAELNDLDAAGKILESAAARMIANGKKQWTLSYPTRTNALADIERGVGYVLERGGRVVAYAAVIFTGEPAYEQLNGKWLSDRDYVVVHRIAVADGVEGQGLGREFLRRVGDLARSQGIWSFRIDTNFDNFAMLHLLEKSGFQYCGDVIYPQGSRMAFELLL